MTRNFAVFVVSSLVVAACTGSSSDDDLVPPPDDGGLSADVTINIETDGAPNDAHASDSASSDGAVSTCSDGSPIVSEFASCPGTAPAVPASLATSLSSATRGDIVSLDSAAAAESTAPCFPVRVCIPKAAPPMLFSDSPESPSSSGVLYADTVGPGRVRIYVYHTNGGNDGIARKFPVVVLNQGAADAHATILQKGIAGPSVNYVMVGKSAVTRWFASTAGSAITIPAGSRVVLDPDLDAVHAAHDELVHAIYDVSFDAPVKVSVVAVQASDDAASLTATLPLLPADATHQRATFAAADRVIETEGLVSGDGIRKISLGGNEVDLDLSGKDVVDGTNVALAGNYGVFYTLLVGVASHQALILVPRGGAWGGGGDVTLGEDGAAGPVAFPSATESASADGSAVVAGRFATTTSVRMHFISAGGSSLPVHLATVPF